MIKFLQEINKLKSIKRTGWLRKNVKNPESVADHSFRVALMAYLLCPDNLDKERMIKMALLNDLPEAVTGDIVTTSNDSAEFKNNKLKKEISVFKQMIQKLNKKDELLELFKESESLETEESRFLKQIDKLEMAFQALEYESSNMHDFDEFWKTTEHTLNHPKLIEIFEELKKLRK